MHWLLLANLSAIFSAIATIFEKKLLFKINALEFSFLVSIAVLVLSFFVPFYVDITCVTELSLIILIAKSIVSGIAFLLVMLSLEKNQISTALPLLGTTPAVTAILAIPFLNENLFGYEWLGIILIVLGTFLLEKKDSNTISKTIASFWKSKNYKFIFAAVGLFALSSIADKLLLSNYKTHPLIVMFYQHLVYCIMFGIFILIKKKSLVKTIKSSQNYAWLLVLIAVLTVAYRLTQLEATKLASVALVLAIKRTSILYASFFGGSLFLEERLKQKMVGAVLIVIAGFIIIRYVS